MTDKSAIPLFNETNELASLRRQVEHLQGGGGGGTSGGMSEDWKANVDRQLEQLHADVRNLLYGIVGSFVVLAGMVGGLYVRTDSKFEAVETRAQSRAEKADDRLAKIEATLAAINAKLDERTPK